MKSQNFAFLSQKRGRNCENGICVTFGAGKWMGEESPSAEPVVSADPLA